MSESRGLADVLPLSPAQEGLFYHSLRARDDGDAYVVQCRFRLAAPANGQALHDAADALLDRHPNLRACFRRRGTRSPVQLIPRKVTVDWAETALADSAAGEQAARLRTLLDADRSRPFDITKPPLVRCLLVRYPDQSADLVLTMHHILADGWSMPLLARDLADLYVRGGAGLPRAKPYRDYLAWLRDADGDAALRAWEEALSGVVPTRITPSRTEPAASPAHTLDLRLSARLTSAIRLRGRESGVTVNTLARAAWGLTLAKMTGSDDVVFGAVASVRPAELPGVESMVGLLINTLPARVRLRPGERVNELLRRLQEEQLKLAPHQHARLADVQRPAGPGGLFDTVLAFENYPRGSEPEAGDRLWLAEVADGTHYPLTVTMMDGNRLWIRISHHGDSVPRQEAGVIAARLARALRILAEDGRTPVAQIDISTERERRRLLAESRGTGRAPDEHTVPGLFTERATQVPGAVAVQAGNRVLTYCELDAAADRLASHLMTLGVVAETPVAILLDRSPELIIAELAVLKAGGCYVPLDPAQPQARLEWLLSDCRARVLVSERPPRWLPDGVMAVAPVGPHPCAATPRVPARPDSAAYVMYTSGSTGTPKGVVTTHQNIVDLATDNCFRSGAHQRVLLHSPHSFDAATYETWIPLLAGGTVVAAPPGPLDVSGLRQVLADGQITAVWLTAELFRALADLAPDALAGVHEAWTGGDVVSPDAVRRVQRHCPGTTVVNGYGPTEATTFATCHRTRATDEGNTVPIGHPLGNTGAFVLDRWLRPVPIGTAGELYITGTGLARGYLGAAAPTAERFIATPYGEPGERMYRTGDLARWTRRGELEFVGRADGQLKIRGHRVEPGELEAALEGCPGVRRAVAIARLAPGGGRRLDAYLVLSPGTLAGDVRRFAAARLPAYLLPSRYVAVSGIPLTEHGKVDRGALALTDPLTSASPAGSEAAPRTAEEHALCDLFARILDLDQAGPDLNFFEAGGHSLLAMRLAAAAEQALGRDVPITALYDAPSPAALADLLCGTPATRYGLSAVVTLRAEGASLPLFCLPPGMGLGWSYAALLPHTVGRPVYALQAASLQDGGSLPTSISQLALDYLKRIRALQPDGPYLLLGRSFGGLLAYEVAAQLRQAGQQVGLAAVVDAIPGTSRDGDPLLDDAIVEAEALRILMSQGIRAPGRIPAASGRTAAFEAIRSGPGPLQGVNDQTLGALIDTCVRNIHLAHAYRPARFDGLVDLFTASAEPDGPNTAAKATAWRQTAAAVRVHELSCRHSEVMQPRNAASIARILGPIIEEF